MKKFTTVALSAVVLLAMSTSFAAPRTAKEVRETIKERVKPEAYTAAKKAVVLSNLGEAVNKIVNGTANARDLETGLAKTIKLKRADKEVDASVGEIAQEALAVQRELNQINKNELNAEGQKVLEAGQAYITQVLRAFQYVSKIGNETSEGAQLFVKTLSLNKEAIETYSLEVLEIHTDILLKFNEKMAQAKTAKTEVTADAVMLEVVNARYGTKAKEKIAAILGCE